MTSRAENKVESDTSKKEAATFLKALDRLAGDEANLKISFQEIKFSLGKTRITLNGEANFDIIHSKADE